MTRETTLQALWRLNRGFPLVIGVLLVINILAYALMSLLVTPKVSALERRFIEEQAQVRSLRQLHSSAASPQELFRHNRDDLEKFREFIPHKGQFTALIQELFSLAQGAGLTINQVNYDPRPIPGERLLQYGLNFAVTGDYGQIKRFVFSLEQSSRLIAIEQISLSGAAVDGQNRVSLNLRLSTYFKTEAS